MMRQKIFKRIIHSILFRTGVLSRIGEVEKQVGVLTSLIDATEVQSLFEAEFGDLDKLSPLGVPLIRIGSAADGGYVIADTLKVVDFVISIGVGRNIDAESFLGNLGIAGVMFDGTIEKLPELVPNFEWIQKNLYGRNDEHLIDPSTATNYDFVDSIYIIQERLLFKNIILKIDCEGSEYSILEEIRPSLYRDCIQIVIEFHNVIRQLRKSPGRLSAIFEKLQETHALIVVHPNNFGASINLDETDYPDVLEMTWMRKSDFEFTKHEAPNQVGLFKPNNPHARELRFFLQ
jgi:hypothetical protein